MRRFVLTALLILAASSTSWADPTVTLALEAVKDGQTVGKNMPIHWTITATVSTGDNEGLALIAIDLVQDAGNASFFDLPPADEVPTGMTNFSRPAGISNPGEGAPTGYIGVQRGTAGQMNLVQIGGGQNTFGEALPPGTGVGESANIVGAVGQGGSPQVIASGTFSAPQTPGIHTFRLENALANVLTVINPLPDFSPVQSVTVTFAPQSITFTVWDYGIGDLNCDGAVNGFDIDAFVAVLGATPPGYLEYYAIYPDCDHMLADLNGDGAVNGFDIDAFVALLGG
ncbi:MAG: hypothetical protein KKB50_02240 [Planctomycetes bacterium]|nr:hypothetical protein [Planctomycetota bacterium]